MDKIQSMSENFDILKIISNDYWLAVRIAKQRKHETWAMKRNCPKDLYHHSPLPRKEYNQMQCIYFVFCIFYSRTFTCIRSSKKPSWPGKLLNFTEIHRKYYKKLSFSFGINLSYALWFGKIRIWFSSPGTTRGLTLLYISRYFSIYLLLFVLILSFVRLLLT